MKALSLSRSYADIRYENILKDNFFSEYRINNFDIYDQLGVKRLNIDEIIIDVSDTQNANEFRIDLLLNNLNFNMNESFFDKETRLSLYSMGYDSINIDSKISISYFFNNSSLRLYFYTNIN